MPIPMKHLAACAWLTAVLICSTSPVDAQEPSIITATAGGYRFMAAIAISDAALTVQDANGRVRTVHADIGQPREIRLFDKTHALCLAWRGNRLALRLTW